MSTASTSTTQGNRVKELRPRFKALCEATDNRFQNWQIRVHRSLSWLERALETPADDQPDGRLLFGWIAFNALYGRWDEQAGFPASDAFSWKEFLKRVLDADQHGLVANRLQALRDPILKLTENKFLDLSFWQNPTKPGNLRRRYFEAMSLFFEKRWLDLLTVVVERIYVLRGQMVHGAATRGSRLNRETIEQCRLLLEELLLPIVEVVIETGAHDNWPPLCYPPVDQDRVTASAQQAPRPR